MSITPWKEACLLSTVIHKHPHEIFSAHHRTFSETLEGLTMDQTRMENLFRIHEVPAGNIASEKLLAIVCLVRKTWSSSASQTLQQSPGTCQLGAYQSSAPGQKGGKERAEGHCEKEVRDQDSWLLGLEKTMKVMGYKDRTGTKIR